MSKVYIPAFTSGIAEMSASRVLKVVRLTTAAEFWTEHAIELSEVKCSSAKYAFDLSEIQALVLLERVEQESNYTA